MAAPTPEAVPMGRLHQLLRDAGLSVPSGLPDPLITDVTCDSRRVAAGTRYVGLPGEK